MAFESVFDFRFWAPLIRHRVAQTGQGILTNMFEHVDAQRIVRVYEEAWPGEQRREPRRGGGLGFAFFGLPFLAKQER
ncbi:MAG: hypothetical protein B7Y56_06180 [Gallionellales bacterium 35-53-114]|nr:MAG: hypothetical protein B7Y56_06180 [Gallionellales bacterium 35-53-114]OZB09382.1 MAG: hypothetical protein B7X61_06930 [Gallionellales bacterium 39-52-133]